MPLYEYQCKDCDREVEVLVRSEAEQPECPECGGERLVKLLSVCAAPSSGGRSSGAGESGPPVGPCGSACGCFPPG